MEEKMKKNKLLEMIDENKELFKSFAETYDAYVIDKKIDHVNVESAKKKFFDESIKKLGGLLSEMGVIISDEDLKKFTLEWGREKFNTF